MEHVTVKWVNEYVDAGDPEHVITIGADIYLDGSEVVSVGDLYAEDRNGMTVNVSGLDIDEERIEARLIAQYYMLFDGENENRAYEESIA